MRTLAITPICLLCAMVLLAGCTDADMVKLRTTIIPGLQEDMATVKETVEAAKLAQADIGKQLEKAPDGEWRDKLVAANVKFGAVIEQGGVYLTQGKVALDAFAEQLQDAQSEWDVAIAGVQAAAPYIPAPWNVLVPFIVFGLTVGDSVRTRILDRRNRAITKKIIKSVDPIIKAANLTDAEKLAISAAQGADGKKVVDEAQGKKLRVAV